MAAACSLGVIGVNGAAPEGGDRGFHESGFVERVGVNTDLHVVVLGNAQAAVDRRRCGAPVFVQLQSHRSADDLLGDPLGLGRVALAQEAEVQRQIVGCLEHHADVVGPRCAGGRTGAGGRAGSSAEHRRQSAGDRFVGLLWTDEVNVGVDAPGGQDLALAGDHLGRDTHHHRVVNAGHHVGVAGFADADDAAVLDADISLEDAGVIDDQGVGDQQVQRVGLRDSGGLAHALAEHLASAELALVPVDRVIVFDLQHQAGVTQPQPVAGGRSVDFRVCGSLDFVGHVVGFRVERSNAPGRRRDGVEVSG